MRAMWFLAGAYPISADGENTLPLLETCRELGIETDGMKNAADGGISFLVPSFSAGRLFSACASRKIKVHRGRLMGIPGFFYRHRRRAGMVLGCALALALLLLSRLFVWDVRVKGAEHMSCLQVKEALAEAGLGVGDLISSVDTRQVENALLLSCDGLAWASVTLDGTVALVQVVESVDRPSKDAERNPCNLVADADGQIEYMELYRGQPVVKVGQAVRKGELLVSGVLEGGKFPFTRAAGQVYARTHHTFTVKIPLRYGEKIYGKEKTRLSGIDFFNFSFNFFKNSGNEGGTYDIIKVDKSFSPFGDATLPFSLSFTVRQPYALCWRVRDESEALRLAYEALERQTAALALNAQLLEKDITTTITEDAVTLSCTLTCVRNIAKQQDFTYGE